MPIDEKELGEALAKPSVLARIFGAKARPDQFDAQIVELTAKVDALTAENADLKARLDKDAVDAKAAAAEAYAAQVVAENKYPPAAKDSIREVFVAAGKEAAEKFAATLKAMPVAMFGAKPTGEAEPEPDAFSAWVASPGGAVKKAEFVSRNKGDEAKALAELRNIYNQSRAVRV
jgi:predicted phage tail protein